MTTISRRQVLGLMGASVVFPSVISAQGNTPIKIGGLLPLSGAGAIEGHQVIQGFEFAFAEANAAGGINGRSLELIVEDDESNSSKGVTAVRKLIEREKVPFILGTYPTAVAVAASKVAREYGVPMLSGGSTGAQATDENPEGDPWFFRPWPDSNLQGEDTAKAIVHQFNAKRVAIIHDNTNYGTTLAKQCKAVVEREGGEIIFTDNYNIGEQDFSSMLTRLRQLRPDAVYIGGWAGDGATIVREADVVGLRTQFVGSGSMLSDDFIELAGEASEGFAVATMFEPSTPNHVGQAFAKRFTDSTGNDTNTLVALGFDSASIGIEALRRAGEVDGRKVQEILKSGMGDFDLVQGPEGTTAAFDEKGSV